MKTKTSATKTSMRRSFFYRETVARLHIALVIAFAWFALSPQARAVCQEGCSTNQNTDLGEDALLNNTGTKNTAVGFNALVSNTEGSQNTATGASALASNTTGGFNTATGLLALGINTTGSQNTATGVGALGNNTDGGSNTATGVQALGYNTDGLYNTATGVEALVFNTSGSGNTATGVEALLGNTTGLEITATGFGALYSNTTGIKNMANGANALFSNTTGNNNTANGFKALSSNRTGGNNIALGFRAGSDLTIGDNNIDIGNSGNAGESNTIRIGTTGTQTVTYIAGIYGQAVAPVTGAPVLIDGSGRLGTMLGPISSARRFKHDIKPMDKASEAILALKPVTFRYKKELDPKGISQFGLVAEDVEKVNPDLVVRDEKGKPYTVRYEAVNAMLLNEFIKARRQIDLQQKQIDALTAGLQKVSAQLELSKPAPQTVQNSQ